MKSMVFDTGPIISLGMNNLLGILKPLKKIANAKFYITPDVKKELVDRPLTKTKKFQFEALRVLKHIRNKTLEVKTFPKLNEETDKLLNLSNQCFYAFGHNMEILHRAEVSALVLHKHLNADAFFVDERSTRLLIENPKKLASMLSHRLKTRVHTKQQNIKDFRAYNKDIKVLRSVELVMVAYEKGLLNDYLPQLPHPRKTLLESLLWGLKLNGCAISKKELYQVAKIEGKV